jgi:hypothetical protein
MLVDMGLTDKSHFLLAVSTNQASLASPERMEAMGQLVNAIGADIVMLQETAVPLSEQRLTSLHDNYTIRFANAPAI